jgi:hypothetical protein
MNLVHLLALNWCGKAPTLRALTLLLHYNGAKVEAYFVHFH